MRFLQYEVLPKQGTPASRAYAGAHAACWINVKNKKVARKKAEALIAGSEWMINKIEDEHALSREGYSKKSSGLRYFEQALIDGEVVVFYTWPKKGRSRHPAVTARNS